MVLNRSLGREVYTVITGKFTADKLMKEAKRIQKDCHLIKICTILVFFNHLVGKKVYSIPTNPVMRSCVTLLLDSSGLYCIECIAINNLKYSYRSLPNDSSFE